MTRLASSQTWSLYQVAPSFILGFHGCDLKVGEAILASRQPALAMSRNDYDWLGNGIYFWENSPQRALDFAIQRASGGKNSRGDIKDPFVLGAVIDLGRCLNLVDVAAVDEATLAYERARSLFEASGIPLPRNIGGQDRLKRHLDKVVFETLHDMRAEAKLPPYQTVRGIFFEGGDAYDGAGFGRLTHIQVCVRDHAAIKGYFRPIADPPTQKAKRARHSR